MKQKRIKAVQIHRDTEISESNLSQLLSNKNLNMSLDYFLRLWFALDCPPIADCLFREDLKPKRINSFFLNFFSLYNKQRFYFLEVE